MYIYRVSIVSYTHTHSHLYTIYVYTYLCKLIIDSKINSKLSQAKNTASLFILQYRTSFLDGYK